MNMKQIFELLNHLLFPFLSFSKNHGLNLTTNNGSTPIKISSKLCIMKFKYTETKKINLKNALSHGILTFLFKLKKKSLNVLLSKATVSLELSCSWCFSVALQALQT